MEEANVKKTYKLPQDIKKVVFDLTKLDGKRMRRLSAHRPDGVVPCITITAELRDLGLKKGDWVLVGIENNKIVIEKVASEEG